MHVIHWKLPSYRRPSRNHHLRKDLEAVLAEELKTILESARATGGLGKAKI
jgi:hypothetical protein